MYFLVKLIQMDYNVVYENVQKETTWVFKKDGTCRIIKKRLVLADVPELEQIDTVHLFDAKAGNNTKEIFKVDTAHQIVFSSTNVNSYKQFMRGRCYYAIFPSTTKDEFMEYAKFFNIPDATIQKIISFCGYGRVDPLLTIAAYKSLVHRSIQDFDPSCITLYASIENNARQVSSSNPAILLDAFPGKEIEPDETNLEELHRAYWFDFGLWDFCSNHICKLIFEKYGTKADEMVASLYVSLQDKRNLAVGPLIGRLFEMQAPKLISNSGITFQDENNKIMETKVGEGLEVVDCDFMPLEDVINKCTDKKIYSFGKTQKGFDCFIPPNYFIGCTDTLQTKGKHPISLSFAIQVCELLGNSSTVKYVTAVPNEQINKWNARQSFSIHHNNVQKNLSDLPKSTQQRLEPFKQYLGGVVMKRYFHSFAASACVPQSMTSHSTFCCQKVVTNIFRHVIRK